MLKMGYPNFIERKPIYLFIYLFICDIIDIQMSK